MGGNTTGSGNTRTGGGSVAPTWPKRWDLPLVWSQVSSIVDVAEDDTGDNVKDTRKEDARGRMWDSCCCEGSGGFNPDVALDHRDEHTQTGEKSAAFTGHGTFQLRVKPESMGL